MTMHCEILSIGSELTSGQNLDTNSQWLSQRLAEIGIPVGWHTTIADDLAANVQAFRIASERAQLVVATGGLGPTLDDLTRQALAEAAGVTLVEDPISLGQIQAMFSQRQRAMPERNRVQALFPLGAKPLPNSCGTAPGIWMRLGQSWVAAIPGVPFEMRTMYAEQVKPRLIELGLSGGVLIQRKINTFGAGESAVEEKLADLTQRGHVPEVGITASDATIALRIFGRGANEQEALAQIAPVERTIRDRLGDLVFGIDGEELQEAVFRLLSVRKKTLATAESVTGGLVAHKLTNVPGVSAWFLGGIVSYDSRIKVEALGVPQDLIDQKTAVSPEVAQAMAVGVRQRFKADLGVSTVGYAGPDAGGSTDPVGLVYSGLAWEGGSSTVHFNWTGGRVEVQRRAAKLALNHVRLFLERMV